MRLIFYSLIVLNVVYFGYKMVVINEQPPEPSVTPTIYPDAKSLILVSEQPELVSPRVSIAPTPVAPICTAIGPFEEQVQASEALAQLQSDQYQASLKQVAVADKINWVYIPAFPTKKAALKRLAELNTQEIDSFLVTESGPYNNSISLGYFRNAGSAQGFVKRLNASGIKAKLTLRERSKEELWINIPISSLENQSVDSLQQFMQQNDTLREEVVEC